MKPYVICMSMMLVSGAVRIATAATYGPVPDFKGQLENPSDFLISVNYPTAKGNLICCPATFVPTSVEIDQVTVALSNHTIFIFARGAAWDTLDDPDSAVVHTTTMYGVDVNPAGNDLRMTGFSAEQAAAVQFVAEKFIGNSGTEYHGVPLGAIPLASLPAVFPDFDLSIFEGDPTSVVYAFRTTKPRSDFGVPEPAAIAFLSIGLSAAFLFNGRRRQRQIGI